MTLPIIKYTNRDFTTIKRDLIDYAKIYYPDTYKDFNKASFGALLMDLVSLIGDQLNFYVDYNTNEVLFDTSIEFRNIQRIARSLGYKQRGFPSSQGEGVFYIRVPATTGGGPDLNYAPRLKRGSTFLASSGAKFTLLEDVDFQNGLVEVEVADVNSTTNQPTFYVLKHRGAVLSGEEFEQRESITNFQSFLKILIKNENVSEIISVHDLNGHEYYYVDYLSQNIVFKPVQNTGNTEVPYKLIPVGAPRRFTVEYSGDDLFLVFGKGSIDNVKDPANLLLNRTGRVYISDRSFDPTKILESDKFGVSPANTTLIIKYRANVVENVNVGIGGLNQVGIAQWEFPSDATNSNIINEVKSSLLVDNEKEIVGQVSTDTTDEIRQRAKDNFATQNRAVTREDYISLCYRMDSNFGSVKRANIIQDTNSFKRNLNLYIVSEDSNGYLTASNIYLKENLRKWLLHYKMINDTIDILDAKIVNIGINFEVIGFSNISKYQVLTDCINALKKKFNIKMNIGEGLSISSIYKTLNLVESVVDTTKVEIEVKTTADYNFTGFNVDDWLTVDGRFLNLPESHIFEIKYPNKDIKGTVI